VIIYHNICASLGFQIVYYNIYLLQLKDLYERTITADRRYKLRSTDGDFVVTMSPSIPRYTDTRYYTAIRLSIYGTRVPILRKSDKASLPYVCKSTMMVFRHFVITCSTHEYNIRYYYLLYYIITIIYHLWVHYMNKIYNLLLRTDDDDLTVD